MRRRIKLTQIGSKVNKSEMKRMQIENKEIGTKISTRRNIITK